MTKIYDFETDNKLCFNTIRSKIARSNHLLSFKMNLSVNNNTVTFSFDEPNGQPGYRALKRFFRFVEGHFSSFTIKI